MDSIEADAGTSPTTNMTEELYKEILYGIKHNVGIKTGDKTGQTLPFNYIQDAFNMSNERHEELLTTVTQKAPSGMSLNVEVIKAKGLQPKDSNGSSSPYVTMYIGSLPSAQYNTSVKPTTLDPSWKEQFSLPLKAGMVNESLIVEVWHFKASNNNSKHNTMIKKMSNLPKLMKELAVTTTLTGKYNSELIGRCSIPLQTISTFGLTHSFDLFKNDKPKHRGSIKLRLSFSAEKNGQLLVQEHKLLLRIILQHELKMSKVDANCWSGEFSEQGEAIIAQHIAPNRISADACALAQWSAFTTIHTDQALPFDIFKELLDNLLPYLNSSEISFDENKMFWDGAIKLLPSCFSIIRKVKIECANNEDDIEILSDSLSILSAIGMLSPPKDIDLFPRRVYGWLIKPNRNLKELDIYGAVEEAIQLRAQDFLFQINELRNSHQENDEINLQNIIKVIELVQADLQYGLKNHSKLFKEKMECDFTSICYIYYENELSESFQAPIEQACKHLKRSLPHQPDDSEELDDTNMEVTLFNIYGMLREFSVFGAELCPDETSFKIAEYYEWFKVGVANMLDMKYYEAMRRIEKAIELDTLMPVDETVKHTSSAIDTIAIFYPIKIFWIQLNWPDIESSYTFMVRIVDGICQCCVYYAQKMFARLECLGKGQTAKWCLAINNIEYVRQVFPSFIEELELDGMIATLAEYRSQADAQRCDDTFKSMIDNALDLKENHILEMFQLLAHHICATIHTFLLDATYNLHNDGHLMDRIMMYVEESFNILIVHLNEVHFKRITSIILKEIATIFHVLIRTHLDPKRDSHQLFANLFECLQNLNESLGYDDNDYNQGAFAEIEKILHLHSYETRQLIHLYYTKRHEEQLAMADAPYGQLTICGNFNENSLELELLNARNLKPSGACGLCNPYVQIKLIPNAMYEYEIPIKCKTKVQKLTNCPLFDEKFWIPISENHKLNENALIMFSVKNKELLGISNKYIGECFVTFRQIADSEQKQQINLILNRPTATDCEYIATLKLRSECDKVAQDFGKGLKRKLSKRVIDA